MSDVHEKMILSQAENFLEKNFFLSKENFLNIEFWFERDPNVNVKSCKLVFTKCQNVLFF